MEQINPKSQGKRTAMITLICVVLMLIMSALAYILGIKAQELIRFGKSPTAFAIATVVVAILAFILVALALFFGIKMLRMLNGREMGYYIIISIYLIFIAFMLLLSISGIMIAIPLI